MRERQAETGGEREKGGENDSDSRSRGSVAQEEEEELEQDWPRSPCFL